ncbi:MAG: phospholipase D-like domain-containing protein [Smithellaceae bacterium]|nr:cardiolipin synthase B [Syntrophaceae bacterium]MDD4241781.1 phospholipase D-like domain-containing protein [Smithellaceae bacterium]NLX50556.1 cardiolipin synthase B [Deltaproteobacteria bacterium]
MISALPFCRLDRHSTETLRGTADRAFSRAAGAPLVSGNRVRLLQDATENYPAWLDAIAAARRHIHLESFFLREDATGREFARALMQKAREGVQVRLLCDWLGVAGKTSEHFWSLLRLADIDVRLFNPPRPDSPLGWLSRDHRKVLTVDSRVGFISGLCIAQAWKGIPEKNIAPWRDTGVEVRGPAVWDIEQAFAHVWSMTGGPIPEDTLSAPDAPDPDGVDLRIVASVPATAGLFRLDQLVAALARKRLWLTDAYYAGTTVYAESLKAAARDGVDVRLLVPGASDLPLLKPLSRAGYRPLIEAGIRIFEWNGSMLHAKTAVADGHWARVGSTNLNFASWFGNCEMDVVIENDAFASQMEALYLRDMQNATELVLDVRHRIRAPEKTGGPPPSASGGSGSVGRVAAGAVRIGRTVGSAFTSRQVLEPAEARLAALIGGLLLLLALLIAFFPRALAWGLAALLAWFGGTLLYKSFRLFGRKRNNKT